MKTIQQLLQLSKNPYYVMTADEKKVLDDFLSKKKDTSSKKSRKKSSKKSSDDTPVHVSNVVKKTDTRAPEASESVQSPRTAEDE